MSHSPTAAASSCPSKNFSTTHCYWNYQFLSTGGATNFWREWWWQDHNLCLSCYVESQDLSWSHWRLSMNASEFKEKPILKLSWRANENKTPLFLQYRILTQLNHDCKFIWLKIWYCSSMSPLSIWTRKQQGLIQAALSVLGTIYSKYQVDSLVLLSINWAQKNPKGTQNMHSCVIK